MKRFWDKVKKSKEINGCWEWQGALSRLGYGHFKYQGKTAIAHRIAWQLVCGEIPNGLCVLHACDNPKCVNPNHLFLGTMKDNTQDMMNKQRHAYKITGGDAAIIRCRYAEGGITHREIAEEYGLARAHVSAIIKGLHWADNGGDVCAEDLHRKLTRDEVIEIREKYANRRVTQRELGRQFGVNPTTISCIVRGKTWKNESGEYSVDNKGKLTKKEVSEIRKRYACGGVSYRQLGNEYGLHLALIGNIVTGKCWHDVDCVLKLKKYVSLREKR